MVWQQIIEEAKLNNLSTSEILAVMNYSFASTSIEEEQVIEKAAILVLESKKPIFAYLAVQNPEEKSTNNALLFENIEAIIQLAQILCLSGNSHVKSLFIEIGIDENSLKWMMEKEKIQLHLKHLKNELNYSFDDQFIMLLIRIHLGIKLRKSIINNSKPIYKGITNENLTDKIKNTLRDKNKRLKKLKNNSSARSLKEFDLMVLEQYELVEKINAEKSINPYKFYYAGIEGNTFFMLEQLFIKILPPDSIEKSGNQHFRDLFPLFNTILPEKKWPKSEEEFEDYKLAEGKSFELYKSWQLRKFIKKDF